MRVKVEIIINGINLDKVQNDLDKLASSIANYKLRCQFQNSSGPTVDQMVKSIESLNRIGQTTSLLVRQIEKRVEDINDSFFSADEFLSRKFLGERN